jgi:NTP pyrophosphatase (non-canonical NTP hydrolase)
MDEKTIMDELRVFVSNRDWGQFHTEANLAKSISIEAAELLEHYQWNDSPSSTGVLEELADVLTYCYLLCSKLQVSPIEIIHTKLKQTLEKYPIDRAKGNSKKYTEWE